MACKRHRRVPAWGKRKGSIAAEAVDKAHLDLLVEALACLLAVTGGRGREGPWA